LTSTLFCFQGFASPGSPVMVDVTAPDGRHNRDGTQNLDGTWFWTFAPTLEMPIGTFRFRVTQSGWTSDITGTIVVVQGTEPRILQTADTGPAGSAGLQIELTGYPPGTNVDVFLYGPGVGNLPFLRPLPVAIVNGDGDAHYAVNADPSDPPGQYAVWLNPEPRSCKNGNTCAGYRK
jgi:hypothetical protein